MGLTIYGVLRSRTSRPVWLAKELGLAFRHVPVIQAYRQASIAPGQITTASPDFRAVAPQGKIPAIEDDGLVLTESLAITLYLARKHGGPLAPKDAAEDALMTAWSLWAAIEAEPLTLAILQKSGTPAGVQAAEALPTLLAHLETALAAGGGFLVGGRFTAADLNVAEIMRYAQGAPELLAPHPGVVAWLAACQSRPAFREMMAERNAEPA